MRRVVGMAAVFVALAVPAAARQAPASTTTAAEIEAQLRAAGATSPDMMVARMHNSDAWRVNVVRRTTPQGAIAHTVGTEVHYVIEGTATLVTGGSIVRPAGGPPGPASIRDGTTREVRPGDVVIVPVGTPHWYSRISGTLTYLEVRFDVKER